MPNQMIKPESELRVAGMFDKIAPRYDILNAILSAGQDRRWRKHLLASLPAAPESVLLDVATGTGDVIIGAAKSQPYWQKLVGVDISDEMLARARLKAEKADQIRKISFQNMSATRLDLPDQFCDAVTISFGLRNVVAKEQALKEFYRVLKPGGELFVLEFFLPDQKLLSSGFRFYFHHILPRIGALLSDKEAYRYLPESVETFYSTKELKQNLESQNFTIGRTTSWLFGSCKLIQAIKKPLTQ